MVLRNKIRIVAVLLTGCCASSAFAMPYGSIESTALAETEATCECKLETIVSIGGLYGTNYYGPYSELECNAIKNASAADRRELLLRESRSSLELKKEECEKGGYTTFQTYNAETNSCSSVRQTKISSDGCRSSKSHSDVGVYSEDAGVLIISR